MVMISKRMAMLYCKAIVVILVLSFTLVQLASIGNRTRNDQDGNKQDHLEKPIDLLHVVEQAQLPVSFDKDGKKSVINEKLPAIESDENHTGQKLANKDNALLFEKKDVEKHEQLVAEEAHILGKGDLGPDQDKQEQIQQPGLGNDVIVEDVHGEPQIEEPKEKVNIENAKVHDEEEDDEFPAHDFKDIKKMKLKDIQLPDHMEAVRLEIDGHLNKDYKKEIILGNHEEFELQQNVEPEKILEHIFEKVDKNGDHYLSLAELEEWIINKVREHFDEANEETARIFNHLDMEKTGLISWHNFHVHFLVAKGYDDKTAQKHATDYETIPLNPDEKERLIRYKFRWAEADEEPQDNKLNLHEFKAFRHPEQSKSMLDRMVEDIIDNLDRNNDGEVSEEEFVALPPGEMDGAFVESDRVWQEERRKEYKNVIDLDRDGKVTRLELKNYVDPQNPNHARLEAENLFQLSDNDKDDQLSLEEVLDNSELFLGSKMVDTGRNFHDEF